MSAPLDTVSNLMRRIQLTIMNYRWMNIEEMNGIILKVLVRLVPYLDYFSVNNLDYCEQMS